MIVERGTFVFQWRETITDFAPPPSIGVARVSRLSLVCARRIQPSGVAERLPQQVIDLAIDAAQFVVCPASQCLKYARIRSQ